MFCVHCGKEIPDNAGFCSYCGKKLLMENESGQSDSISRGNSDYSAYTGMNNQQVSSSGYNGTYQNTGNIANTAENLFDTVQSKIQETLKIHDSLPITHPFQKLGGFLAVLTYGWLITSIYMAWCVLKVLFSLVAVNAATSGLTSMLTGPILLIVVLIYGVAIFLCMKMFLLIQKKDIGFLRFYEVTGIALIGAVLLMYIILAIYLHKSLGSYGKYAMSAIWASAIPSLIMIGGGFALMLRYFWKSVRVRTYFGTDAYLRNSIFLSSKTFPTPAVPDRV